VPLLSPQLLLSQYLFFLYMSFVFLSNTTIYQSTRSHYTVHNWVYWSYSVATQTWLSQEKRNAYEVLTHNRLHSLQIFSSFLITFKKLYLYSSLTSDEVGILLTLFNHLHLCKIRGFHSGDYEECCLLGCGAAHTCSPLSDYSTLKMEAIRSSETSVYPSSTQRHIPEDNILHLHLI
jgi:hypothetical protein